MNTRTSYNNPYIVGSPVSGQEMFFGRRDVFEWIRLNLMGEHGDQPLIIAGQRRTGKTSVLKQVENGRLGTRYLAVFIDLQGLFIENATSFFWELAHAGTLSLESSGLELPSLEFDAFLSNPYRAFQDQWLNPILKQIDGKNRLLFLFDETEILEDRFRSGRLDRSAFDFLRSMVQNTPQVSMIFGMGNLIETFSQESIRLFNVALYKQISYLGPDEAVALISEPVPYEVPEDVVQAILSLTSGHPYYTQLVCHTLFEQWQTGELDQLTAGHVYDLVETMLERGTAALSYVWLYEGITSDDRLVMSALASLADHDQGVTMADIQKALRLHLVNLPTSAILTALDNLQEQQIISQFFPPTFRVDLVRRWLRQERPLPWAISRAKKVSRLADQYAIAAQILLERGDSADAQAEYERALLEDPTHVNSILGLSQISVQKRDWTHALLGFEKVLNWNEAHEVAREGFVRARLGRAQRNMESRRWADAEADYRAILSWEGKHEGAWQGLCLVYACMGQDALEQGSFDEAMQAYKTWVEISPDSPEAQAALAALNRQIYQNVADNLWDETEHAIEASNWSVAGESLAALQVVPGHQDRQDVADLLHFVQGQEALAARNFQLAVYHFEPLYEKEPGYRQGELANLYLRSKELLEAPLQALSGAAQLRTRRLRNGSWLLVGATLMALLFGLLIFSQSRFNFFGGGTEPATAVVSATPADISPVIVETAATETSTPTPELPTATATQEPTAMPTETAVPATATPLPTQEFPEDLLRLNDDMPMKLMSVGTFTMGAVVGDENALSDEIPQHVVRLDSFYIDQHEVTGRQYVAFLTGGQVDHRRGCSGEACILTRFETIQSRLFWDGGSNYRIENGFDNHPMTGVSWYGADAYCRSVNGRLPTEAEWEYAARSQGEASTIYPWGDEPPSDSLAIFNRPAFALLRSVGLLPAGNTADGVSDLAGGVSEWVNDFYSDTYYENSSTDNPRGAETGIARVIRGGSWRSPATELRISNRLAVPADELDETIGFRCVVPISTLEGS